MSHRVQKRPCRAARPPMMIAATLPAAPSINRSGGKGTQTLLDGLGNNLITLNGEVLLTGREIDAWRSTPRWE